MEAEREQPALRLLIQMLCFFLCFCTFLVFDFAQKISNFSFLLLLFFHEAHPRLALALGCAVEIFHLAAEIPIAAASGKLRFFRVRLARQDVNGACGNELDDVTYSTLPLR